MNEQVLDFEPLKLLRARARLVGGKWLIVGWPIILHLSSQWRSFLTEAGVLIDLGRFYDQPNKKIIQAEFIQEFGGQKIHGQKLIFEIKVDVIDTWLDNIKENRQPFTLKDGQIVLTTPA